MNLKPLISHVLIGRAKPLIAVRDGAALAKIGDVSEQRYGDLLFFRPAMEDPNIAYKGMRQWYLFARRTVRSNLRSIWERAWQNKGLVQTVPQAWDIDHVFPVSWAENRGFEYVLMKPVPSSPNRSAGAGLEKAAGQNADLLAQYVDIDEVGNYAYLSSVSIAKLLGIAPGAGAEKYPGLERIKPDLERLQQILAY